jgi:hypothetical protein
MSPETCNTFEIHVQTIFVEKISLATKAIEPLLHDVSRTILPVA